MENVREVTANQLRVMANDLYRRSDNVPLSTDDGSINRVGELREVADKLSALASELNGGAAPELSYPIPPVDVLARPLTPADVSTWPEYFILGPGREIASKTFCAHEYYLTDSCPNCP